MDKNRKLRRYNRKDYSQLVDFPVEIVGRDGVVRRYSFEESVRLYQRRIASAESRYTDQEIAQAEAHHCRRRIEQLRRSYFARYGWSAIQGAEAGVGELAGEVAAFLRRCLESSGLEPEGLSLSSVEVDDNRQVCFVCSRDELALTDESYLLYIYRFEEPQGGLPREAFFDFLQALQGVRSGGESVEGLVAFHHSADCGLILTGRGGQSGAPVLTPITADPLDIDEDRLALLGGASPPDPLREGMILLRQGDQKAAYRRFTAAYEANHYRRSAYIGAAVVADQLGEHADAETAALMGSRYFAGDDLLGYLLAVARLRRGDGEGAQEAFSTISTEGPPPLAHNLLAGLIALQRGRLYRGRRLLAAAAALSSAPGADQGLVTSLRWVRALLTTRGLLRAGAAITAGLGLTLGVLWSPWFLLLTAAAAILFPAIHAAWRRQLTRALSSPGHSGLSLIDPESLRDALKTAPVVDPL